MIFFRRLRYLIRVNIAKKSGNCDQFLRIYMKFIMLFDLTPEIKKNDYNSNILNLAEEIFKKRNITLEKININFDKPKILILNSEIYDSGGHTEVAMRCINAFKDEYPIDFYLTTISRLSKESAPVKSEIIKNSVNNFYESSLNLGYDEKIIELYRYVIENKITTINVNMHMYDTVGCAVLGLLKKYTDINIVFWNHGDHWYSLGTDYADIILTRCRGGRAITPYLRNKTNVKQLAFLEATNEVNIYSFQEILSKKEELKIPPNAFVTMTGCIFEKFGDEYFNLIKNLLDCNPNLYHLCIFTINKKQKTKIKNIIGKNADRCIIIDFVPNFDFYVQLSDLYIDSFPQGSALTLVDCIKHSKPVVIKIDKDNPIKSFEGYLYEGYEYACETSAEMFEKTSELINNREKYMETSKQVRQFYMTRYDINSVKKEYMELIK